MHRHKLYSPYIKLSEKEMTFIDEIAKPGSNTADFFEASFAPNLFRP